MSRMLLLCYLNYVCTNYYTFDEESDSRLLRCENDNIVVVWRGDSYLLILFVDLGLLREHCVLLLGEHRVSVREHRVFLRGDRHSCIINRFKFNENKTKT
jgi:hypothetical protein